MSPPLTDALAIIGAATGTAALSWDVYKWKHTAPLLKVSVTPNMTMVQGPIKHPGEYMLVRVANTGMKKTTLTALAFRAFPSRWKALRRRGAKHFIVPLTAPKPLPHPLDVGDSWESTPMQDEALKPFLKTGVVYCLIYHALSDKPVKCRVKVFPLSQED